jgi:hypothetical protein
MLRATVIFEQRGQVCYNAMGEMFYIDDLYELKTPFYVSYVHSGNSGHIVLAAFQEKSDLIEWMNFPLRKMVETKAHENMEKFIA